MTPSRRSTRDATLTPAIASSAMCRNLPMRRNPRAAVPEAREERDDIRDRRCVIPTTHRRSPRARAVFWVRENDVPTYGPLNDHPTVSVPTEPIGSLPRPPSLIDAIERHGSEAASLDPL